MRTVTKLLLGIALAMTLSSSAGAVVSLSLVQAGGTCLPIGPHACSTETGGTLVLDIQYSIGSGDFVTLIRAGLAFDAVVQSFNTAGSTETGVALWSGGSYALNNLATGDIGLNPLDLNEAIGWEKSSTLAGGGTAPCAFGACTSLGTAAFVLSGGAGVIQFGNSTVIGDPTFMEIIIDGVNVSLGTFYINVPEPATASLLGLALVGVAAASRRSKRETRTRRAHRGRQSLPQTTSAGPARRRRAARSGTRAAVARIQRFCWTNRPIRDSMEEGTQSRVEDTRGAQRHGRPQLRGSGRNPSCGR